MVQQMLFEEFQDSCHGIHLGYLMEPFQQIWIWFSQVAPMTHTKNSKYDQEIPQSQTADKHMAPRGKAAQPSRDTRKTN